MRRFFWNGIRRVIEINFGRGMRNGGFNGFNLYVTVDCSASENGERMLRVFMELTFNYLLARMSYSTHLMEQRIISYI